MPTGGRVLASAIPHARLVEIADAGHFPFFSEEPAAFQDAVRAFLASAPTARISASIT